MKTPSTSSTAWIICAVACATAFTATGQPTPFNGFRFVLPATIECEQFDFGGQSVAYYDKSLSNSGGKYRNAVTDGGATVGVDIYRCGTYVPGSRGYCVGVQASEGEWLIFTIESTESTSVSHTVEVRAKGAFSGIDTFFHFEIDGTPVGGTFRLPVGVSGWQTLSGTLTVPPGVHALKLKFDSGTDDVAVDYITIYKTPVQISIPTNTVTIVSGTGPNDLWTGSTQTVADHNRIALQYAIDSLLPPAGGTLVLPSGGPYYVRQIAPTESQPLGEGTCEWFGYRPDNNNYAVYIGKSHVKIQGSGSGANQTTFQAWDRVTTLFYVGDLNYYAFPGPNPSDIVFENITFKGNPMINSLQMNDTYGVERRILCPPSPLVTSVTIINPSILRNNFTGWVGFYFQVGSKEIIVTELGRWVVNGNNGSHRVKLFNANGTEVTGGEVTVNTAGQEAGKFAYVPLPPPMPGENPVTLQTNTTYLLMSEEFDNGDQWYDYGNTQIMLSAAASGAVAVWADNLPSYTGAVGGENRSYGPVNLNYTMKQNPWNMNFLGSLVVFFGDVDLNNLNNGSFAYLRNVKVNSCTFYNPSNIGIYLAYVSDGMFQNNTFSYFNGITPADAEKLLAWVAINGPSYRVENIYVLNNTFNGNVGMTDICHYGSDGLTWLGNGGRWVVKGNTIQNYRLEAVSLNAGPYTVVENVFYTISHGNASTALSTTHNSDATTLSSAASINSTYCFVNNTVVGGVSGVSGPVPSNWLFLSGPYNMIVSGNSFDLPTEYCFNGQIVPWPTVAVGLEYCQTLTISGNKLVHGGRGTQYSNYNNHTPSGANFTMKVLCNDFTSAAYDTFLLQDIPVPSKMRNAEFIANRLRGGGTGHHLYLTWANDPNNPPPTLTIRGNEFTDGVSPVYPDPGTSETFGLNPTGHYYRNPPGQFADGNFSLY